MSLSKASNHLTSKCTLILDCSAHSSDLLAASKIYDLCQLGTHQCLFTGCSCMKQEFFPYIIVTNVMWDCINLKVSSGNYAVLALELGFDNCRHPFSKITQSRTWPCDLFLVKALHVIAHYKCEHIVSDSPCVRNRLKSSILRILFLYNWLFVLQDQASHNTN